MEIHNHPELRGKRMSNEQDDKLNRLLHRQGSMAERTRLAKELDPERLQLAAAASCPQAKEEIEHRRAERALQANNQWFKRPVGMTVLAVAASVIASLIVWAILR
jgi:hypothetical protein